MDDDLQHDPHGGGARGGIARRGGDRARALAVGALRPLRRAAAA